MEAVVIRLTLLLIKFYRFSMCLCRNATVNFRVPDTAIESIYIICKSNDQTLKNCLYRLQCTYQWQHTEGLCYRTVHVIRYLQIKYRVYIWYRCRVL